MAIQGKQVVDYLMQYLGTPYQWGGDNPDTNFDCSGLLQWGFGHFGISIPRVTYDQIGTGQAIGMNDLQVGDAVFFDTEPGTPGPDHVGIYIGNGKMLHAPHTGDVVKISDITSDYYASHFVGGRRFNGVIGGGDQSSPSAPDAPSDPGKTDVQKKLSPEELAAQYGWAYAFLNSDPSLKGLFGQAVDENWTSSKFQAKLKETDFWKNNSDVARQALQTKATDPATWNATMVANKLKLQTMAASAGAMIPGGQLDKVAEQMAMMNLSDEQINQTIGGWVDFTSNNTMNGKAGMVEHGMRQYADQMGVDLNPQSIKSFAQMMVKGLSTQEDYQNYIKQQAISAYPGFQQQIEGGQTMKDIANPYIQMMAQHLELDPTTLNLSDPTIKGALNGLNRDGEPAGKNLVDFQDQLRGDPRFRGTQQAQDKTMAIGTSVLRGMGLMT